MTEEQTHPRRIMHMDMDAFFAAIELLRHPELTGKPLVVGGGGDPFTRGVVSTASYEARKFGIRSAMPLRTAHQLCRDCIFLPVDYQEYARVSRKVKKILAGFTPIIEDVGIDEAFLDVSEIDKPTELIAQEIKTRIKERTGLTCSIGIGPNKLLAKIASDLQKPDGLTVITPESVESMVWPLPVRKLWGVGPKTEARLKGLGVTTINALAAMSEEQLIEQFGRSYGNYLYRASHGIDDSPLVTHWEPKSISRETTFEEDVEQWQAIARTLAEQAKLVTHDMKKSGYRARTIGIKIRFSDFKTYTRAKTLDAATDNLETVRKTAFECLARIELKQRVRLIGVRTTGLEKPADTD
ncbi:MAG TPA: DNA polymerase IV [Syntrophorhabdales bacterium]|nr:DNA polymerase IV [Syntrophorhabdales bacterium]